MFARFTNEELALMGTGRPKRKKLTNGQATKLGAARGSTLDKSGNVWCGKCDCRVLGGRCTNTRCSTQPKPNKVLKGKRR